MHENEWAEILRLRFSAFRGVGKFPNIHAQRDMQDRFDLFSTHFVSRDDAGLVCAVRLVPVLEQSQSENLANGFPVPHWLAEGTFMEASRGCSEPRCRGTGHFSNLMQFLAEHARTRGATRLLANCHAEYLSIYRRLGFRTVSEGFHAYGKDDCRLILWEL